MAKDFVSAPDDSDRASLDALFVVTYDALRRLARRMGGAGDITLNPTALVNECWMKLARTRDLAWAGPLHFRRIAARAMRQVLVETARRRQALKRGCAPLLITLDESTMPAGSGVRDVLVLDAALEDLARLSPRQAAIVEARFFGGLDLTETAALFGISESTVLREWRAARAWLGVQLRSR